MRISVAKRDGCVQACGTTDEIVALILIKTAGAGALEVMPANPAAYWTPRLRSPTLPHASARSMDSTCLRCSSSEPAAIR